MLNSHVIEFRSQNMNRELSAVWRGERPESDVRAIEEKWNYRHGWFFDDMAGANFKNDGGRGIVWVDQPYLD